MISELIVLSAAALMFLSLGPLAALTVVASTHNRRARYRRTPNQPNRSE